jgi:hypothetical protein
MQTVDAFMAKLEHPHKAAIEDLRVQIRAIDPRITEAITWNAPSFLIVDHFATFKLHPPTQLQLVLHTGAKLKAQPTEFVIADPHKLLIWPAKDRSVLTFTSHTHVIELLPQILAILRQWITQLEVEPSF